MGKIEETLKAEISRLAKKEAKAIVRSLKQQVTDLKKEVAGLKKADAAQEKELKEATRKLDALYTPEVLLTKVGTAPLDKIRLSPGLIKKLRKKLKITQADLARLAGVSPITIGNWETGKAEPKPEYKAKIVALREYSITEVKEMLEG